MRSIVCPSKWSEVTLRKAMAYFEVMADEGEDSEKVFAAISVMTGADVDDVRTWPMATFQQVCSTLSFLQNPPTGKQVTVIALNGRKYSVVTNPKMLCYGAFTDLMHYVKNEKTAAANLHHAFACCLVRRGRWPWSKSEYDGAEHLAIAEAILDLPVTVVKPNTDFFLRSYLRYSRNMAVYLEIRRKGLERKARALYKSSGGLML